jgi:hypothetical protein
MAAYAKTDCEILFDWVPEIIGKLTSPTSCCGMNDLRLPNERVRIACEGRWGPTRISELRLNNWGTKLSGPIPFSLGSFMGNFSYHLIK